MVEITALTFFDHLKRAYPLLLLAAYGIFLCSYFFFRDYSEPYRFFARVVFPLGIFVIIGAIRDTWKHPVFLAICGYMLYLLLSGLWSDPLDWYRFGQKVTISLYLLSFIAITHFLVHWNRELFERMLQLCTLVAALAATVSIVVFYREQPFPATRLIGIGSLTNINEFANVYGVFALMAMFFALRSRVLSLKAVFFLAVVAFICVAWFGQSRTAFTSVLIALVALSGLMLNERKVFYASILAALVAALVLFFPSVLEQAFLRGQGLRPSIWAGVWEEAVSRPIVGHGIVSNILIVDGAFSFDTAHNAFLQVFWQGGGIGLFIFLMLLAVAFRNAWSLGLQGGDFTIFCVLLFAVCTMMTGVDTLIARPRDQWMLFWFPLALLIAYQSIATRSPPGSAPAVSESASA